MGIFLYITSGTFLTFISFFAGHFGLDFVSKSCSEAAGFPLGYFPRTTSDSQPGILCAPDINTHLAILAFVINIIFWSLVSYAIVSIFKKK